MAKQYVVKHDMIGAGGPLGQGGLRKGAAVSEQDAPEGEWDRWVATGAVGPATEEELAALPSPEDKAIAAGKAKDVPADSAAMTTGQPGGAPVGEGSADAAQAGNTTTKDVKK